MISLHTFCKDNGLAKSSVHRKCQELNIDTADGLSQESINQLLIEFGKQPVIDGEVVDLNASASSIVPVVHTIEAIPDNSNLVVRRIQPQIVAYDTTELTVAADLNQESMDFNINAMGVQLVEQMKQLGKLHAAQARQAYAHTVASELSGMAGKPQPQSEGSQMGKPQPVKKEAAS